MDAFSHSAEAVPQTVELEYLRDHDRWPIGVTRAQRMAILDRVIEAVRVSALQPEPPTDFKSKLQGMKL